MSKTFSFRFPERVLGNIFVRTMSFALKDEHVHSHAHNFDHTTYCIKGKLSITREDGETVIMEPGDFLLIKAGVTHEVLALEDDTLAHCIYSHHTRQGEVVQEFTGWNKSYL